MQNLSHDESIGRQSFRSISMPQSVKSILVPPAFPASAATSIKEIAQTAGVEMKCIFLPADPDARLEVAALEGIQAAFFGSQIPQGYGRSFFSAVRKAPNLKWLHLFNVGVDHPIFAEMLQKGVRLTTSAGTTAVPIARTALAGLLMLSRGFPRWMDAQRRKDWAPIRAEEAPPDLDGQTLCILGLGGIGSELARLALGLGMHVVGIRRSPRRGEDPVDELFPPQMLKEVLSTSQWLAITCPLTDETRGLIDREAIKKLPKGAAIINVGRGEIIDEGALIEAVETQHLLGAYLDVFHNEPLPTSSRLWELPNVILSPHNSAISKGNESRILELLFDNLGHWLRDEALVNEVTA